VNEVSVSADEIRIPKKGNQGSEGETGDFIVSLKVADHKKFSYGFEDESQ
jgi:DnaJ-class molecular chaperone